MGSSGAPPIQNTAQDLLGIDLGGIGGINNNMGGLGNVAFGAPM